MMTALIRRLSPRQLNALGFLACAALLAYAYYAQSVLRVEPCPLCIFQRIGVAATGVRRCRGHHECVSTLDHGPVSGHSRGVRAARRRRTLTATEPGSRRGEPLRRWTAVPRDSLRRSRRSGSWRSADWTWLFSVGMLSLCAACVLYLPHVWAFRVCLPRVRPRGVGAGPRSAEPNRQACGRTTLGCLAHRAQERDHLSDGLRSSVVRQDP